MAKSNILCLLVIGTVVLAYLPSLSNDFVWLDHTEIVNGSRIVHRWSELDFLFVRDDRGFEGYHRPFYNLLHSLDFYLWGLNPLGFHLSSIILHILNVALIWALIKRVNSTVWIRLAICLLWGLHPINTAAVGLIHARADLFVTTMLCATLLLLERASFSGQRRYCRWRVFAFVFFAVALLTKETALMFPIGLVIMMTLSDKQSKLRDLGIWLLFAFIACGVVILPRLLGESFYQSNATWVERLFTFATVYNDYFFSVLFPKKLFVGDTVTRFFSLNTSSQVMSLALVVILLSFQAWVFLKVRWSRPWLLVWNLALVPVSQIIPILHFRADRFLYLPSLGLVGLVVEAGVRGIGSSKLAMPWSRTVLGVLLVLIASVFGIRTADRLRDFKNDESLFTAELHQTPDYREGLSALALSYDRRGERIKAERLWQAALKPLVNRFSYVHFDVAVTDYSANLLGQHRYYDAYLFLKPRISLIGENKIRTEARYNLAVAAFHLGRFDESFPIVLNYVNAHPNDALAHYLLGWNAYNLGDISQAQAAFIKYLKLSPNAPDRTNVEFILRKMR